MEKKGNIGGGGTCSAKNSTINIKIIKMFCYDAKKRFVHIHITLL